MYLTKLWYLKNIDMLKIFQELGLENLMHFATLSHVKMYQDIYFPEQGSNHVYFVQDGHVKLSKLDDEGRLTAMEVLRTGEIFGKLALEGGEIPNEFAEAADDVTVCMLSKPNFEAVLARVPRLHFHLTKRTGHRVEEYEVKISNLVFKDATRRIINFIARYGHGFVGSENHSITVETPLSCQDIANLTGTSPETVARALSGLQEKGLIECVGHSLLFRDLVALQRLAR